MDALFQVTYTYTHMLTAVQCLINIFYSTLYPPVTGSQYICFMLSPTIMQSLAYYLASKYVFKYSLTAPSIKYAHNNMTHRSLYYNYHLRIYWRIRCLEYDKDILRSNVANNFN